MLEALESHFPEQATWTRPQGGMFIWATLPSYIDTSDLLAKALRENVAFVPGAAAYVDGQSGTSSMRLNFSGSDEDEIREGIRRIGKVVGEQVGLYQTITGEHKLPAGPAERESGIRTSLQGRVTSCRFDGARGRRAMKVAVLKGGRSLERQVSMRSGARVEDALAALGHEVVALDVGADLVATLREQRPDAAFIALHGQGGEDGTVQELLEILAIPYTGPGVRACTSSSTRWPRSTTCVRPACRRPTGRPSTRSPSGSSARPTLSRRSRPASASRS